MISARIKTMILGLENSLKTFVKVIKNPRICVATKIPIKINDICCDQNDTSTSTWTKYLHESKSNNKKERVYITPKKYFDGFWDRIYAPNPLKNDVNYSHYHFINAIAWHNITWTLNYIIAQHKGTVPNALKNFPLHVFAFCIKSRATFNSCSPEKICFCNSSVLRISSSKFEISLWTARASLEELTELIIREKIPLSLRAAPSINL